MLKTLIILIGATLATCSHVSSSNDSYVELWKIGDDGLTNKLHDQLVSAFNAHNSNCTSKDCRKYILLIRENVLPIDGSNAKIAYKLSLHSGTPFENPPVASWSGTCTLETGDCVIPIRNEVKRLINLK